MQKYLGDILIEKGYLSSEELNRALAYQMQKSIGQGPPQNGITSFLLEVARTKYNRRGDFCLGKILTELALLPEEKVREALEIQRQTPASKPRGRIATLNAVMLRINSSFNLIDLLNQILVLAAELVEAECASLIIHDHSRDSLVILAPTGPKAEEVRDLEVPKDMGIVGWVYENSRSVISNDTSRDPRFYPEIDITSGFASRQILCVPLTVKGKRLGAIETVNKGRPWEKTAGAQGTVGRAATGFTRSDRFLLETFSAQAAIAIENTRLADACSRLESDCRRQMENIAARESRRAATLVSDALLHDMRNTLVPLQGYVEWIRKESPEGKAGQYASYIEREVCLLVRHVEDIVDYLKGNYPLKRETLILRDLVQSLKDSVWVECRLASIVFAVDVPSDIAVCTDRELLLRCLGALFRNSKEAMPTGGTIAIRASKTEEGVLIRVSDTGRGIPPADREKVFEPFYTNGKPHRAGLGLSVARSIVEALGGSLREEEAATQGAAFVLTLPK